MFQIMLDFSPSIWVHVIHKQLFFLITADTNNFKFISPFSLSFFEHFLIMCHWLLARPALGLPKIYKPNFSLFVLEIHRIFLIHWTYIFYSFILVSCTNINIYLYNDILNIMYNIICFFIEFNYFFFVFWLQIFMYFNLENIFHFKCFN